MDQNHVEGFLKHRLLASPLEFLIQWPEERTENGHVEYFPKGLLLLLLFLDHTSPRVLFLHIFHLAWLDREPYLTAKCVTLVLPPGFSFSAQGTQSALPTMVRKVGAQLYSSSKNIPTGAKVCGFVLCNGNLVFTYLAEDPALNEDMLRPSLLQLFACLLAQLQWPAQPSSQPASPLLFSGAPNAGPNLSLLPPCLLAIVTVSQLFIHFSFVRTSPEGMAYFTLTVSHTPSL